MDELFHNVAHAEAPEVAKDEDNHAAGQGINRNLPQRPVLTLNFTEKRHNEFSLAYCAEENIEKGKEGGKEVRIPRPRRC